MAEPYPTSLVEWMRAQGVASVTLSGDAITSVTLGTAPAEPEEETTQPSISPAERERRERQRRRDLALRVSGGPVLRLSEVD